MYCTLNGSIFKNQQGKQSHVAFCRIRNHAKYFVVCDLPIGIRNVTRDFLFSTVLYNKQVCFISEVMVYLKLSPYKSGLRMAFYNFNVEKRKLNPFNFLI